MRQVVFNMTMTLDGRITGPGGESDMDWVLPHVLEDVVRDQLDDAISTATTAVMGSTNAEGYAVVWPPVAEDDSADPRDRRFAQWLQGTEKIVLSSTGTSTWSDARVLSGNTAELLGTLQQEPGRDILVLNSVSVMNELLRADLVDRLDLVIVPEILGAGRVLFEEPLTPSHWTVQSLQRGDSGVIAVKYLRQR